MQIVARLILIAGMMLSAVFSTHAGHYGNMAMAAAAVAQTHVHSPSDSHVHDAISDQSAHCLNDDHIMADSENASDCCVTSCVAFDVSSFTSVESISLRLANAKLWSASESDGIQPELIHRPPGA